MTDAFLKHNQPISKPYRYMECGLDNVYLLNGYEPVETPYGAGVAIEDEDELLHEIAISLVVRRPVLSGKEVRFLRSRLEKTQAELAKLLRVDAQTVARWEKGQTALSGAADGLVRLIYLLETNEEIPDEFLAVLTDMDVTDPQPLQFMDSSDGWKETRSAA